MMKSSHKEILVNCSKYEKTRSREPYSNATTRGHGGGTTHGLGSAHPTGQGTKTMKTMNPSLPRPSGAGALSDCLTPRPCRGLPYAAPKILMGGLGAQLQHELAQKILRDRQLSLPSIHSKSLPKKRN
ncbi:hypothetical protein Anapl_12928 [Anas platyrhynchos]|uniref:Uncharacterized protein n=1 Tax=Anas platyrhynchos TaxID=8839 RepID=R0L9A6_ANAPL|nr:hypothetical protein Anapl_12928 [Anas platyrhynchos]